MGKRVGRAVSTALRKSAARFAFVFEGALFSAALVISAQASAAGTPPDAASGPQTQPGSADLSKVTLVVGQQGSDNNLGFIKSHLFDDTPYKIQYALFQSPTATLTALASGRVDIANNLSQWTLTQGAAAATTPWTAATAPYRTVLVTGPDPSAHLDRFVIVASRQSGITDIHQAKGKRWGYIPGASPNLLAYVVLHRLGWTPNDIQTVALDGTNQALALETGRVDVIFNVTDNVAAAIQHGAKVLGTAQDYGLTVYTGYQANSRAIDDPVKGRAIADFVHRLVLYHNWVVQHPKASQAALVEGLHETPAQAADVYLRSRLIPIAPGDIAAYSQQLSDFALQTGLIHQHVDAAALLDNRFANDIDNTLKETDFKAHLQASYH